MSKTITRGRNVIGLLISVGVGLFLWGGAVYYWLGDRAFKRGAATAIGRVAGFVRAGKRATLFAAVVEFTPPGGKPHRVTARLATRQKAYEMGDEVRVLYRPSDPADARLETFSELSAVPMLLLGMGAIIMASAFALELALP